MRPIYIIGVLALMLASCAKDILPPEPTPIPAEDPTMTTVRFDFSVDNPVMATDQTTTPATIRAVDENAITNLQLILFSTDGTRYDFNLGDKKFLLATIRRGQYTVYASSGCAAPLKVFSEAVINQLFSPVCDEATSAIPMSFKGIADFSIGKSSSCTVKLVRIVAKLRFNVTTASNVTITKMSLQNAPCQTKLFPQANPGYNFAERPIGATGGSFTLYMPEHLAGTVASITNQTQRTAANAPANATYLKIEGEITGPGIVSWIIDKKKFESVVYLGSNVTGDFNIKRNNDYRININIASDLTTDTRIEIGRVGYEIYDRWTPDRKFLLYESIPTTLYFNGSGTETVSYKCVFEGFTLGKFSVGGKVLTGNTVSGTITTGKKITMDIVNNEELYTPENHRVNCTLTFTDASGGMTEFKEEFRFSNRTSVQTLPIYGVPPSEKTANITASSDESIVPDGTFTYTVYHAKRTLQLTVEPLPGYVFKGWYKNHPFKSEEIISTSPTVSISVPRKWYFTVFARIEKA